MTVYEPAEDSELLAAVVRKFARGKTLDIGTGSGYLADVAHECGCTVSAIDVNKDAVQLLQHKPYRVVHSNMFSNVAGKFDTLICNPPYLPNDDDTDIALHGGMKGFEYIVAVLAQAKNYLRKDGQFLFLISSLTQPAVVEAALREHSFTWKIVANEKLFMEELYVYRATLLLGVPATYAGRGKRSVVYKVGATKAVKVSTQERAAKEASLLRTVNEKGIGPKLFRVQGAQLWMRYITGEPFAAYFERTKDMGAVRKLFAQARTLDEIGLNKKEFTRPGKNVLVTKQRRVVLLDFERAIYSHRPANVQQLAAWAERALQISLRDVVQAYARKPTKANFQKIIAALPKNILISA